MKKYTNQELKKMEKKFNLILNFGQFVLENPKTLSRIPEGAHVALMPDDDLELARENFEITSSAAKKEKAHILAFIGHRIIKEQRKIQLDYKKRPLEVCWT